MAGWYEVMKNDDGEYWFVLKAENAQIVLRSEQYGSKGAALNGIASVQKNAGLEQRYELKTAADGRFFFNLRAANHQVVGTSQMYTEEASRAAGIESVRANGPTADVRDV